MVDPAIYDEEEELSASSIVEDDDITKPDDNSSDDEFTADSHRTNGFADFIRLGFGPLQEPVQRTKIAQLFLDGLGKPAADAVTVTAAHKNLRSSPNARARFVSFRIHEKAMEEKLGGVSTARFAWYGGSRDEIRQILSFGFSRCTGGNGQQRTHGVGVHLSSAAFPTDCMEAAIPDQDGTKHLLFCRVLLGRMEAVPAGSTQSAPSSVEFDNGVDDVANPRRFVVWSSFMNSHIFPAVVLSFKDRDNVLREASLGCSIARRPRSPWMSFPALLGVLSQVLDQHTNSMVSKSYDDFMQRRVTREQMIRKLRQIVGDGLLASIIKSHQKELTIRSTQLNWV
ncbi:Probable inactive poly [ADP-ribose] polymerase SRO2 [Linum grandiflorum]